ncbi:MAG: radical SAM protein [Candidatus Micrarchaeaceae archaeon]
MELKKPYKLNFAITYRCQSKCLTCNIWKKTPQNELTLEEIRNFAKKNNYFKWIELTGGEVFLRNDLVEIVEAFNTYSPLYILTMPTNSLTNHDIIIDKLISILKLGISKIAITVSLDGYRELHDKIRGIPGNYDKAIDLYKRLIELKKIYKNLYFVFGYTISAYNIGKFEETINAVKKEIPQITYNDFHFNLAQISDNYYGNAQNAVNIKANDRIIADEIYSAIKKRKFEFGAMSIIERAFLKGLYQFVITKKVPVKSRSLEASIFLDSFGDVYPSIMVNNKLGNIRETQYYLDPILQSEEAQIIRKSIKESKIATDWTACEAYQALVGDIKKII